MPKVLNVLLFDEITPLDFVGPVEVFARLPSDYEIVYVSLSGGKVRAAANLVFDTVLASTIQNHDLLLIPGGWGTRALAVDTYALAAIHGLAERSDTVLCVCTGSALLAATGFLNGKTATSNKRAWDWVVQQGTGVQWKRQARWVRNSELWTSSGVSAGIDMALAYVAFRHGEAKAGEIAANLEYVWNPDSDNDPFC